MGLINTTKGLIEENLLEKKTGFIDNDNEYTTWVEYWLDSELVHRSAHVSLKKPVTFVNSETGELNG